MSGAIQRRPSAALRPFILTLAIVAFAARAALAQAPIDVRALAAPSFESFSARDGLPDGVITAVGVDANGVAYATSPEGLYRFLGHRWQLELGPVHGTVYRRLLLDHAGTLWATTMDGGVSLRDQHGWRFLTRDAGGPGGAYRAAEIPDSFGHLQMWLLTPAKGIYERRGTEWVPEPGNGTLPHGAFLTSVTTTEKLYGERRQWLATGEAGVWYRRQGDTTWHQLQLPGLAPGQVEDVVRSEDADGEALWFSAFGQGVYRIDAHGVRHWSLESGELQTNEVYTISIDTRAGRGTTAWIASRRGLVRIHGDVAQTFDRRYGLPSDQVRGTWLWKGPDGEEVLWLATESGVARAVFSEERWQTASLMGAGAVGVFGVNVEEVPDGERLWVAANRDGVGLYEGGKWRVFTKANSTLPTDNARMIKPALGPDGKRALWLGMESGYLVRVHDGPRFEVIDTPWPHALAEAVLDVLGREVDGVPELWVAMRKSGIWRWRAGKWTAYRPREVQGEWRAIMLREQVDGAGRHWLWAGTNQGLARWDGERWSIVGNLAPLTGKLVMEVTFPDRQAPQVLWAGTELSGMQRVDVSNPMAPKLVQEPGFPKSPDVNAYGAVSDSRGRIYVCSNNGVQQLTWTAKGWASRTYSRAEGMVHEECNTNAQFVDVHDRFWTGTLGGLTVFDPGTATVGPSWTSSTPKELEIVDARVDGEPVPLTGVRVEPGQRDLRVEYTLRSFQREGESRYRTQLLGYDPAPSAWSPEPVRVLTSLAPGHYRLRIEGRDFAGVGAKPVELAFVVEPAWWQRWPVRLLFVLVSLGAVWALARWWTRRLRKQKAQLEALVATRTGELHAANERLVSLSYTDPLTGLANRRRLQERLRELVAAGAGAGSAAAGGGASMSPVSLAFVDVDHFKAINDRLGHPAGDEVLRTIAERLRVAAPAGAMVARYGGEEFACLMPGVSLGEALMIGERMRADVEARGVRVPGASELVPVTISVGVAAGVLGSEAEMHEVLRVADGALYLAKEGGRNLVRG